MISPQPAQAAGTVKRLTRNSDYITIYKKGKLYRADLLHLYIMPSQRDCIRTGVSVSSRVVPNATERNRLKRILKAWMQKNAPLYLRRGSDLAVLVKKHPGTGEAASRKIRETIKALLEKEGLHVKQEQK